MIVVCTGQDNKYFAKGLLLIGDGEFQDTNGKINIKSVCISVPTLSTLILNVYLPGHLKSMVSENGNFVTNKRAS